MTIKSKIKKLAFLILTLSMCSCNTNKTYNDRECDKAEGEIVVRKLYRAIHGGDYSNVVELLSTKFLNNTDTVQLFNLFRFANERLGTIDSMYLDSWQTSVMEGASPKSSYSFTFIVFRRKSPSKEMVKLEKENGEIKIVSYNIDSKKILQKD